VAARILQCLDSHNLLRILSIILPFAGQDQKNLAKKLKKTLPENIL